MINKSYSSHPSHQSYLSGGSLPPIQNRRQSFKNEDSIQHLKQVQWCLISKELIHNQPKLVPLKKQEPHHALKKLIDLSGDLIFNRKILKNKLGDFKSQEPSPKRILPSPKNSQLQILASSSSQYMNNDNVGSQETHIMEIDNSIEQGKHNKKSKAHFSRNLSVKIRSSKKKLTKKEKESNQHLFNWMANEQTNQTDQKDQKLQNKVNKLLSKLDLKKEWEEVNNTLHSTLKHKTNDQKPHKQNTNQRTHQGNRHFNEQQQHNQSRRHPSHSSNEN